MNLLLLSTPGGAAARDALAPHLADPDVRELPAAAEGTGGERIATAMLDSEALLHETGPEAVVLCGDGPGAAASALVAVKLGIPQARVAAGERGGDRNRTADMDGAIADRLCDLLLCEHDRSLENLRREGLADRAAVVGDPATDPGPAAAAIGAWLERLGAPGHASPDSIPP
jgi:UDP-N-acetylglucosamine 2-epimerase